MARDSTVGHSGVGARGGAVVRRRATASVLLTLLALLLVGPSAASARSVETYPPGPHAVLGVLSEQTIVDGAEVVISGDGFLGGSLLRVTIDGEPYSTVRAQASGGFQISVLMRGVGTRLLAVTGNEPDGRPRVVSDPVTVLSTSASPEPSAGSSTSPQPVVPSTASRQISTTSTVAALLAGLGLVVLFGGTRLVLRARSTRS